MITLFRNFAKSKWATGLLVLVALALLFTGGSRFDILGAITPPHVISAGDRSIDQAEFRRDFDRAREGSQQPGQPELSIEDLVKQNAHIRYLDGQSKQLGFLNWAWNAGVRPGKDLVLKQIRKIPNFFDSVTGQFSEEQYRSVLAEQNMTPAMAEQSVRDQYVMQHYGAAMIAGARLPRVYGALVANQALESRDARWFTVTRAIAGSAGAPTDAQLTAFLQQNTRLRHPELRAATVILFDDGSTPAPAITEEEIQKRFDFKKDTMSVPEKRTFITLTAPTRAVADRLAADLRSGKTPSAVGAANHIEPAAFNDIPRSAVSDPAVAAAVFGLAVDQVSDPVQGRVGFTVAKVSGVTPGRPAVLADVRNQIVDELKTAAARARIYDRVTRYENARKAGKTLDQAVAEAGARPVRTPPIPQDGRLGNNQSLPPLLLANIWKLGKGGESEVVDAGEGQYFVVRVDEIIPAGLPKLEDVRTPLAAEWVRVENAKLLANRASALEARIRGGEDIAAVARSVGAPLMTRAAMQQNQTTQDVVGQGVLQGVFSTGRGELFSGQSAEEAYVVGRVDRISAAVPALAAPIVDRARAQMSEQTAQLLMQRAVIAGAERSKATYNLAQARMALGLPAEEPAAAPAAAGAAGRPTAPAPAQ